MCCWLIANVVFGQISRTTPIVSSIDEYGPGQTFEQLVVSRFQPYFGYTIRALCERFQLKRHQGQGLYRQLTKAILGIPLNHKIEEFDKGDVRIHVVYTRNPSYPRSRKRYFLWYVDDQQPEAYLQRVGFWKA